MKSPCCSLPPAWHGWEVSSCLSGAETLNPSRHGLNVSQLNVCFCLLYCHCLQFDLNKNNITMEKGLFLMVFASAPPIVGGPRTQRHTKLIYTKPNSSTPNRTHLHQTKLIHTKPNQARQFPTKFDQPKLAEYA